MLGLLFICCMQQRYQQQPEHQQQPEQQQQQALMQQVTTVLLALLVLSVCGLFGTLVLSAKYGNEAQARDTAQEVQSLFVQAKLDYMDGLNRGEGGSGGAGSSSSLSPQRPASCCAGNRSSPYSAAAALSPTPIGTLIVTELATTTRRDRLCQPL
ncbi:hypothetical protein BOX15_Mlig014626g4 [Macrostomum lignano]|uniref:Uncharacterized protein n=1 Tax=Macrostomum lignano TaxID=282301 RepID=A0A267DHU2_9PLAT|nr:hypothetical protein BOX15_Mlig014626g4 [Macrostomum lignano]